MSSVNVDTGDLTRYLLPAFNSPTSFQQELFSRFLRSRAQSKHGDMPDKANLALDSLLFLYPYHFLLSSPFGIPEMDRAVHLLKEAYYSEKKPKIVIYGDRDADGVISSSILFLFLRDKMGYPAENLTVLVPDEEDKYGITVEVAEKIAGHEPEILITMDCGSSNKDTLAVLSGLRPEMKILVFDHHTLPEDQTDYPDVDAFVNPCRLPFHDERRNLCTAGLAYVTIQALAYAFTPEFDQVYLVKGDKPVYIKNGVEISHEEPDKVIGDGVSEEVEFDLAELWQRESKRNYKLGKVNTFIGNFSGLLSAEHRLYIMQSISMKNIQYKIRPYLALAAIGTVADSMELSGDNRILVYEGLEQLKTDPGSITPGLRELIKVLQLSPGSITEMDFSFSLAPSVNAAGRMGVAHYAVELFTEKDPLTALKYAHRLKKENEKRKEHSRNSVEILDAGLDILDDDAIVVAYHHEVHRGISGIVASKLAEKYQRPAIVLVEDGDCLRGSARAATDENILSLISEMGEWFIQYGGHPRAAGFSLEHSKRDMFIEAVKKEAREHFFRSPEGEQVSGIDDYYIKLAEHDLTTSLWRELLAFAPYGEGNPHPEIAVEVTKGLKVENLGKTGDHVKFTFIGGRDRQVEGVWFFHGGRAQELSSDRPFWLTGEPVVNYFMGREKYQLRVTGILSS